MFSGKLPSNDFFFKIYRKKMFYTTFSGKDTADGGSVNAGPRLDGDLHSQGTAHLQRPTLTPSSRLWLAMLACSSHALMVKSVVAK